MRVAASNGIDRRRYFQGENTLYDIKNALTRNGRVFASIVEEGATIEGISKKPWLVVGDSLAANPPSGQALPFMGHIKDKRRIYVSRPATSSQAPYLMSTDLLSNTIVNHDMPRITNVSYTHKGVQSGVSDMGINVNELVSYIFIPVDEYGTAGAWYYASYYYDGSISGKTRASPRFLISVGGSVKKVEVYRTKVYNATYFMPTGTTPVGNIPEGNYTHDNDTADFGFYKLQDIPIRSGQQITLIDQARWQQASTTQIDEDDIPVYGTPITRNLNLLSNSYLPYASMGFGTARNDGGSGLFGNVTLPIQRPQFMSYREDGTSLQGYDVLYHFYYNTRNGRIYSQGTSHGQTVDQVRIPFQGADGLIVYFKKNTDTQYKLFKEYTTPGPYGFYDFYAGVGSELSHSFTDPTTYNKTLANSAYASAPIVSVPSVDDQKQYYNRENIIVQSEVNRLMEWTNVPVEFDIDESVLLIETARPQEEDQRSFDFYIFTDKGIYYAQRQAEVVTYSNLVNTLTVARDAEGIPIYSKSDFGLVVYTTTGRIIVLSGRQFEYLDQPVKGDEVIDPLWNSVHSIAYNPSKKNLYVGTDKGLFVYTFDAQQWNGHVSHSKTVGNTTAIGDNPNIYTQSPAGIQPLTIVDGGSSATILTGIFSNPEKTTIREVIVDGEKTSESKLDVFVSNTHNEASPLDFPPTTNNYPLRSGKKKLRLYGKQFVLGVRNFTHLASILIKFNQ